MAGADWRVNAGNDFVPDAVGAIERGRSMADMQNVRAERQARAAQDQYQHGRQVQQDTRDDQFREASKSMYEMGEDGSVGINPGGMPKIFGADPAKAYALQQQMVQDQAKARLAKLDEVKKQNDMQAQLLNGVEDQRGWDMALANAQKFGLPGIEQLPKVYDKNLVKQLQFRSLDLKDRLDLERKDAESKVGMRKTESEIAKLDAERRKVVADAGGGGGAGKTEGFKALDKDYAKDYNDWTSTGKASVEKNLDRLRAARAALQNDPSLTGSLRGMVPDRIRNITNERAITTRDDVRASASSALKATLGTAFTEKEGERIMNQAYNESLSPQANIDKITAAIQEIETGYNNNNAKAREFANRGSLRNYSEGANRVANAPQTKEWNGVVYEMVGNNWVPKGNGKVAGQ